MRRFLLGLAVLLSLVPRAAWSQSGEAPTAGRFRVVFDPAVQKDAYTGRVYVVLGRASRPEPRRQMGNWFAPAQTMALDVTGIAAGAAVEISGTGRGELAFPQKHEQIAAGPYWAQAVARRSLDCPAPGEGAGDLYSKPVSVKFDSGSDGVLELRLTEVVSEPAFRDAADTKLVEMRSRLLSEFHGRDYTVRAAVRTPAGWDADTERRWPSVVMISGFGGTHRDIARLAPLLAGEDGTLRDCVVIVPDPSCGTGHSVFADSANNGPWGRMLIEELLPEVDRRFRTGGAETRHVTGISSGGWSSLWLAVTYPEAFAACWSHVPDPVDFRDFQRIDLYAPSANMYVDAQGSRRPLARNGGKTMLWYDDFCRMERVLGRGGQISSFEAVFSPRGADGQPRPLFDRGTGAVDAETARAWEPYDIRLVLERGWRGAEGSRGLRERLAGKLHVYAGAEDNFYLDGAARLLQASLTQLGSDAEVVIVDGMGHAFYPQGMESLRAAIHAANEASQPATIAK